MNDPAPSALSRSPPPPPPPPRRRPGIIRVSSIASARRSTTAALPLVKSAAGDAALHGAVLALHRRVLRGHRRFFAVLFTGRYPQGSSTSSSGSAAGAGTSPRTCTCSRTSYPPFAARAADPGYPATFDVPYPRGRHRPLAAAGPMAAGHPVRDRRGHAHLRRRRVAIIGVFVILFTGDLPEGMFKLILIPYRWQYRASATRCSWSPLSAVQWERGLRARTGSRRGAPRPRASGRRGRRSRPWRRRRRRPRRPSPRFRSFRCVAASTRAMPPGPRVKVLPSPNSTSIRPGVDEVELLLLVVEVEAGLIPRPASRSR